ncbi:hypothetical protein [Polyangium aurulentum]|uniref:hypothetical protein n=1 Tax=Polyangium aurulentum TaxID=2567896 RepID=UPI0010AE04DD|nr:hypothetical protein [Polyangium aurulentum]UQA57198.1 hypothetical protein E8A73_038810 [Polyangium aurulentum]
MPRFIPEQSHLCHVCDTRFTITTTFDPRAADPRPASQPRACPRCGAPLRHTGGKDIGAAKNIVLTHYGLSFYRQHFGSVKDFLLRHCRTARDVDDYLALVERLDFAEWESDQRRSAARRGDALSAEERAEHQIVPKARAEAASGKLLADVRAAADEAKAVLSEERARHLRAAKG